MALHQLFRQNLQPLRIITNRAFVAVIDKEKEARPVQMNSAQYSSDGEKMEQGLKFTLQGDKTEEEVASIVESARAKAFDESINRVAILKVDP